MEQVDFNAPTGWSWKKFKDVCVLKRGYDLPTHARSAGGFPLYSANGVTDYIDQYKVDGPGVVTGRSGTIGKVHFVEGDYWPLNTALYVQKFNGNHPRFIKYFLENFDLTRFASGAAVPTLNRNSLSAELVCVPDSVDEQKRIVEKLDALLTRIDTAIEHLQESVTLADALYASLLDQAFNPKSPSSNEDGTNQLPNGWRKVPLGTIVELSQGTQIPVGDQFVEQDEGFIRFLRISDFVRYDEPPRYILYPGPQYIVQEDDVCMIRYGDAGRAVTGLAGALANNLFKISPNEMLSKRFLFLQLQSPRCVEYLRASNNSSTMPAISFKAVNAMEFNLPPLDEQQQIIEKLNNANKLYLALKGLFENKIRYFNDLKASILDFAFKGEL